MKKNILLILTFLSLSIHSQKTESIIKTICLCTPLNVSPEIINNKLFSIETSRDNYIENLFLKQYEKIGSSWIEISNFKIDDDSDTYSFIENKKLVIIEGEKFFYSVVEMINRGTMYNGRNKYAFIFKNVNNNNRPKIIYYEKWNGSTGKYSVRNQKKLIKYKNYIKQSDLVVSEIFKKENYHINSKENFHKKWKIENEGIYNQINENNQFIKIKPTIFEGKKIYNSLKNSQSREFKNPFFLAIGGFNSPIVVYDIQHLTSKIILIPSGWPNGGGWGFRSIYPKELIGNILIVENDEKKFRIDLETNIMSVSNKN